MKYITILPAILSLLSPFASSDCINNRCYQECKFRHDLNMHEKSQLNRVQPIMHHTFEVDKVDKKFNYFLQICHDFNYDQLKMPKGRDPAQVARDKMNILGAGLIQIETEIGSNQIRVLGRLNDTRIRGGTDWVRLEFRAGDKYAGICNNNPRTAEIMITCNPKLKFGAVNIIHEEERDGVNAECYYLLQLESSSVCNASSPSSWFVVFLKILFFGFLTYLLVGFLYNKFVNKNPRVPHSNFFKQQGNKAADLCDKFFRSNSEDRYDGQINDPNDRPGFGASDSQVVVDQQPEINEDDHLLPM